MILKIEVCKCSCHQPVTANEVTNTYNIPYCNFCLCSGNNFYHSCGDVKAVADELLAHKKEIQRLQEEKEKLRIEKENSRFNPFCYYEVYKLKKEIEEHKYEKEQLYKKLNQEAGSLKQEKEINDCVYYNQSTTEILWYGYFCHCGWCSALRKEKFNDFIVCKKEEKAELNAEIKSIKVENEKLKAENEQLKNNSTYDLAVKNVASRESADILKEKNERLKAELDDVKKNLAIKEIIIEHGESAKKHAEKECDTDCSWCGLLRREKQKDKLESVKCEYCNDIKKITFKIINKYTRKVIDKIEYDCQFCKE